MKTSVFVIFDKVAHDHSMPIYQTHAAAAARWFNSLKKEEKPYCQYPDDFELYNIGEYDTTTGIFTPWEEKIKVFTEEEEIENED